MNKWLSLILSLPSDSTTLRMRAWRALKSAGAATLRDGVYLLPAQDNLRDAFDDIAAEALAAGGTAYVVQLEEPSEGQFTSLFDRSEEYRQLLQDIEALNASASDTPSDTQKQTRKLRKSFATLSKIDFFPSQAKQQVETALTTLEIKVARLLSPDEPLPTLNDIRLLNHEDYKERIWATRCRPWVDRLASAWLIQRFIDPKPRFLWLAAPSDCPSNAIGFDFDGAEFSHAGGLVTFETLIASFRIENAGLRRLAAVIHFLDVGGVQPPEAAGIEKVLSGLRDTLTNDDQLLAIANGIFDGLLSAYQKT